MRFTSLIVELIRARPRLVVWVVLLVQAAIWFTLPMLFYGSPPGDVATVLAIGREYRVGTMDGPPLAFWLADMAFRAAGNHIAGVYLLAQLCAVLTFWWLFQIGRAIVGGPHAVLAVLLTMTIVVFGAPGLTFDPDVLALPIWALILLQTWRVIGQRRRQAWVMLAITAGLLVLTTSAAPVLLAMVVVIMLATAGGRRQLASIDSLFALLIVAVIVLPYGLWLSRNAPALALPSPDWLDVKSLLALWLLGGLLVATIFVVVLTVMASKHIASARDIAPVIARAGVDPLGRRFVLFFALVPALVGCIAAGAYGWTAVVGGSGVALVMAGLAVVLFSGDQIALRQHRLLRKVWALAIIAPAILAIAIVVVQPWIRDEAPATAIPATSIAAFFGDNYQRRTGQPLPAVSGDPHLAALVAMGRARPHWLDATKPARTPWLTPAMMMERGGVVVWPATDAQGMPPAQIAQLFPGLVAEVPQGFDRLVNGRQPPLRIGWAIIRPKAP